MIRECGDGIDCEVAGITSGWAGGAVQPIEKRKTRHVERLINRIASEFML